MRKVMLAANALIFLRIYNGFFIKNIIIESYIFIN